jgi:AcrR family transcriptional regulator
MLQFSEGTRVTAKRSNYHHGDLRAGLVEATRQLVEEKGPDRFSVSDACRLAGVSTAAPYRHFNDREEMLLAVAGEGMERFYELMRAAAEPCETGTLEAICKLGEAYVRFATTEPGVFRLAFGITREHKDNEDMIARGKRNYGVLLEQIAAFLGKSEIDEEVFDRAFPLWTMVHGLAFLLIDEKTEALDLKIDLPEMMRANCRRLLSD